MIIIIIMLIVAVIGIISAISVISNKKVIPEQQAQAENITNNNSNKRTHNIITIIVSAIIIIGVLFLVLQCSDSDSDTYSATCKVCDKTYSYEGHEYGGLSQRNVKCIRMTNMCKECYEIYCYSIGKTPKEY